MRHTCAVPHRTFQIGTVAHDRGRTYAEFLDLTSPDIMGQHVADVLSPLYEEQIRPRLDRLLAEVAAGARVDDHLGRPVALAHAAIRSPVAKAS